MTPTWATTGTPKPVGDPAWPAFAAWVERVNRKGADLADHPIWWACFRAGYDAHGEQAATVMAAVSVVNLTPPPSPWAALSDADLLRTAVDNESAGERANALAELSRRMGAGRCNPRVALLTGPLRKLKPGQGETRDDRRAAVAGYAARNNLEFDPWW